MAPVGVLLSVRRTTTPKLHELLKKHESTTASVSTTRMHAVPQAVTQGGQERTLAEWNELFQAAGLAPPEVLHNKQLACLVASPLSAAK